MKRRTKRKILLAFAREVKVILRWYKDCSDTEIAAEIEDELAHLAESGLISVNFDQSLKKN